MGLTYKQHLINSDPAVDGSVGAGITVNKLVPTVEQDILVVSWQADTAVLGDLDSLEVRPVLPSGVVADTVLVPEVLQAKAVVGGAVVALNRYNVQGLMQVQVRVENASGGALDVDVYLVRYAA